MKIQGIQAIIDSIFNHDEFAIKNNRKAEIRAFLDTTITADDFSYITIYGRLGFNHRLGCDKPERLFILVSTSFCFYSICINEHSQSFVCVPINSLQKIEYTQMCKADLIEVTILFRDYKEVYELSPTDTNTLKFFEHLRSKADLLN